MKSDDASGLILGVIAMAVLTIVLGIALVPVWSPEVVPVLAGGSFLLTLVAQTLTIRNTIRRGELIWIIPIIILGPVGPLAYGLMKATESGMLSYYLDTLSQTVVGEQVPTERPQKGSEKAESVEIAVEEVRKSLPSRQMIVTGAFLLIGLLGLFIRFLGWIFRSNQAK